MSRLAYGVADNSEGGGVKTGCAMIAMIPLARRGAGFGMGKRARYGLRMPKVTRSRSNLALATDERASGEADTDLDEEHLRVLNARAAVSEEAERRGEAISFEDLLEEVDQILHAPAAG
jgi:hypothetical protein